MKQLSNIISVVFHPLFMPLWIMVLILKVDPVLSLYFDPRLMWRVVVLLLMNMVIGPLLSIYVLKRQGIINSMTMPSLQGRSKAYALTLLYYLLTYFLFKRVGLPDLMEVLLFGLIVVIALLAVISLGWKISAHMAGVGGLLALVCWFYLFYGIFEINWTIGVLLFAGIVGTARSYLGAHTHSELAAGTALGFFGVLLPLLIMI